MKKINIKKLYLGLFFGMTLFILLCSNCYASTSGSLSYNDYYNRISAAYGKDLTAPYSVEEDEDHVSMATGDVIYQTTDLYLPGKNGLDVEIKRSFNTNDAKEFYYYDRNTRDTTFQNMPCYQYQNSDGQKYWLLYKSEEYFIGTAESFVICCNGCVPSEKIGVIDGLPVLVYKPTCSHSDKQTVTNVKNKFAWYLAEEDNQKSRYTADERHSIWKHNRITMSQRFNFPCVFSDVVEIYRDSKQKEWELFVNFYDGTQMYSGYMSGFYNMSTREFDRFSGMFENARGAEYTVIFGKTDEEAIAHGLEYSIIFEHASGKRYYCSISSTGCRPQDVVAVSDRFGNYIYYEYEGGGKANYKITDTMGRIIRANSNGISVDGTWVIKYSTEQIPYAENSALQTKAKYLFKVDKMLDPADETKKETTVFEFNMNERSLDTWFLTHTYLLTGITYPTNAKTEYVIGTKDVFEQAQLAVMSGSVKKVKKYVVKQSKQIAGGNVYNQKEYQYDSAYYEQRSDNGGFIKEYRYKNLVSVPESNMYQVYFFDKYQSLRKVGLNKSKSSFLNIEKYTGYGYDRFGNKSAEGITYSKSKNSQNLLTYDEKNNLKRHTYNNSAGLSRTIDYTYGSYANLLTSVQKQNADTEIKTVNTLSEDGKNIIKTEVMVNDVVQEIHHYAYDSVGNVTQETITAPDETLLRSTAYAYSYTENGTTVTQTVQNLTDANNQPVEDIVTVSVYDKWGNLIQETDGKGQSTVYTYDLTGRLLTETAPDGAVTAYTYNIPQNEITVTLPNNAQQKYKYDGFGKLKEIAVRTEGVYRTAVTYSYDARYRLATETEYRRYAEDGSCAEAYTTAYTYDVENRLLSKTTTDLQGTVVSGRTYSYDETSVGNANLVTETVTGDDSITPAVQVSYYNLDGSVQKHNILQNDAVYAQTLYSYDLQGNLMTVQNDKSIDSGAAYSVQYEYNYAGAKTKETLQDGSFQTYTYNAAGDMTSETNFAGVSTQYSYDTAGRLLRLQKPVSAQETAETQYAYDPNGNVVRESVKTGENAYSITEQTYDAADCVTNVHSYPTLSQTPSAPTGEAETVSYTYNALGSVLSMTVSGASPSVTRYAYNELNQCISSTDPNGKTETYSYDLAGNLITKQDRKGAIFTYSYNVWQQPLLVTTQYRGKQDEVRRTYDILGNRTQMQDADGTTQYTYDFLGRLTQETRGDVTQQYTYDKYNNCTAASITHARHGTLRAYTASYDELNRPLGATVGTTAIAYTYDTEPDKPATITVGTQQTAYKYNRLGRLRRVDVTNGETAGFKEYALFDSRGNAKQIMTRYASGLPITHRYYTYDGKNRMLSEAEGVQTYSPRRVYTFDSKNNVTSVTRNEDVTTYSYDLANRLISGFYDVTGNMLADTNDDLENGAFMTYDLWNRLKTYDSRGFLADYTYDGDGRRTSKTVGTKRTEYVWSGDELACEIHYENGEFQEAVGHYYTTAGIALSKSNLRTVTYTADTHGNVVICETTTNDGTTTRCEYSYDAYGNQTGTPNDGDTNPFRYCGEYYDAESGFIYLRNRYYDPATGRFITEDPARDGVNWYVYCEGNPVNRIDPLGLESYVFYTTTSGNDFTSQAKWQKSFLEHSGEKVIMVAINNVKEFTQAWNNIGIVEDKSVEVNNVVIYAHGNERAIMFENGSSTNAMTVNGRNRDGTKETGDINDLQAKSIKKVSLLSCNGGNVLTYYNKGENIASVLSKKVVNGNVYAYDGNVSFGRPVWAFWQEDIGKSSRLATNQDGFHEIAKSYKAKNREPLGKVVYYNGIYKPYGYYPASVIGAQ